MGPARRRPVRLPAGASEGSDAAVASLRQAFASATRAAERLRRRVQGVVTAVALIAVSLAFGVAPASSTPTSQFELDANIVDDGANSIPDWGSIFGRTPTGVDGAPVSVKNAQGMTSPTFVEDLMAADALPSPPCNPGKKGDLTILSGAGSDKNGDALPTWTFESGSIPPNKDDITNLYGAAKVDTDGHRLVYWGLERSNNNGTGHLDVELLQAPMGPNPTGTDSFGCPKGNFLGSRTVGDILLVLDLSKGGNLGLQEVRIWDGDSYEVPAGDLSGIAAIWHNETAPIACGDWNCREPAPGGPVYVDNLATNAFVEGFVDTTALGIAGCFSSFNAKSRSSQEWNSELKDIAFGELNTCDARISITPDGVNEVGDPHTFTGHVQTNAAGDFANAPAGTTIDFAIVSGPGQFTGGVTSCQTVGTTGACSISVTSAVAGTTVVSASTSVQVGPVVIQRSTNGNAGDGGSGNATKYWADGYIKVTPTAVNPVNAPHVFTVEFGVLDGGADTVALGGVTPSVSPTPDGGVASTCADPQRTGDVWTCTVTINSSVAGVFTATASGTATVSQTGIPGTVTITRSTAAGQHGPGGNTGAVKTYVDARISVGPDGLNAVDDPHTFTATVETRDGDGAWTPAPTGTTVTFAETGAGGFVGGDDTCTTGAAGTCSVQVVSATVGTTEVGASATVTVNGVQLTRTTGTAVNTAAGGSANAVKRWVDASITVVETAVNEVGDDHEFLVTVTAHRPSDETVAFTSVSPTVSPAPDSTASTCGSPTVAADGLSATCTFTINDFEPGLFDVDATAVVTFTDGPLQATVTRSTGPAADADAGPNGNTGATKTFVDARVGVGLDGVNAVGDPHTVTGTAEYNDGTGWKPAAGRTITFATTQGPGQFVGGVSSCVAGADGTCSVSIVSDTTGVQWVSASTGYAVLGVTLNRTTAVDGPTDPDNLRKEWVAASITITPTAVNAVGDPHAFDITVTAFSPASPVTFGPVVTSVTPEPGTMSDDCGQAQPVGVDGTHTLTCTLTINSSVAGVFTADASTTVTIGGVVLEVATDGTGGSGPAVKTYVDARISLSPDGVNEVGDPHPMTAHLEVNDGSGWDDAPAGVTIAVERLSGPGQLTAATCTTGATGACTVTLTSDVAGVSTVSATATVEVLGEALTRSTNADAGPGGSDNVTKRWVDGAVSISPTGVNPVGAAHTFTVTATAIPSGSGAPAFVIEPAVTPVPTTMATTCDAPLVAGDVATCTVTITSATPGVFTADATVEITMGGVTVTRSTDSTVAPAGPGGSGPATKTYVTADIQVGVDGVNAVGDPHPVTGHVNVDAGTGRVNAADGTVINFAVVSGPGSLSAGSCTTTGGTGSCTVTLNSGVAGVTVVSAASTVNVAGVTLDLATNGAGANSANLTKRWVDAFVTIAESAVNPLNEPHTFTVTATAIPSGAAPVVFDAITTSVAPAAPTMADTCASPVVEGNTATCTLTINSDVAGQYVANATVKLRIGGAALTRSTDPTVAVAGPGGSDAAVKSYVPLAVLPQVLERGDELPRTGTSAQELGALGLGAILVGTGLVLGARRRRRLI